MMSSFETFPINRMSIPQRELDIEDKTRSNLFAWTGQFSPQFVETLLNHYAKPEDVVLDPFAGSGTTLCEAARKGLAAYGMELNYSACFMAKTYQLADRSTEERQRLIQEIEEFLDGCTMNKSDQLLSEIVEIIDKKKPSALSDILSTLVILTDRNKTEFSSALLEKSWKKLKKTLLEIPFSHAPVKVMQGDCRRLSDLKVKATLLITSPPYINVFNYHQQYRPAVEALGYDVLSMAQSEFGSNRKNRSNRLLTVVQYCIDMALSIKAAMQACKKDARMIYIVGRESRVLGYSFCNSRLIFEIAAEIFKVPCLLRQERRFKNRYGQLIYEDILHFRNSPSALLPGDEAIEEAARKIARRALVEMAQDNPESEHIKELYEAIDKADKVQRSREFERL